jgi:hypothetical protein
MTYIKPTLGMVTMGLIIDDKLALCKLLNGGMEMQISRSIRFFHKHMQNWL